MTYNTAMPRCEGPGFEPDQPEVRCPDKRNDQWVKNCHGDIWMCAKCEEMRFPTVRKQLPAINVNLAASPDAQTEVREHSELLCFVKDKSAVMTFDHLVKVIVDYYKKEEILAARALLEKAKYKIVRRKEPDVAQKTVEDIVKAFLDPNAKLPTFYAIEMSRCPPVDITHCDVTSILRELQALRREVREAGQQQVDVQSMQQQIMELREEVSLLRALHESSRIAIDPVSKTSPKQPPSFAEVASNLRTTDLPVVQKKKNPEKNASKPKSIVGKANSSSPAVVADGVRKIDLFISRLSFRYDRRRCGVHWEGCLVIQEYRRGETW